MVVNIATLDRLKRDLKTRILVYQKAIQNQLPEKSALCEHSMIYDCRIAWQESQILIWNQIIANGYLLKVGSSTKNRMC